MKEITKKTLRLLLRTVPVLPAPELLDLVDELGRSRSSIDEKVRKAQASFQEATQLFDEIEEALKERSTQLERLREEVERYSALAEVEEGKAAALIKGSSRI